MTMRFLGRRQVLTAATAGMVFFVSSAHAGESTRIGFSMPLTGPSAPAGRMFLLGREIWRHADNANGGLLGRPVQFVYYDDRCTPSLVPGIYEKLVGVNKVDLVVSPVPTKLIAVAMPL